MELGKAQPVGVLHDEGIDVGNVDARLNNGGAHQHIRLAIHHGLHNGGQLLFAHLAVAHHHPDLRPQQFLDAGGGEVDGLHPVVEVVDLTAPGQFLPHGVLQDPPVMLQHISLHRLTVGWRLLNGRHIPQTGEGHVQRPGDGGSRQGQHVHLTAHLLEPLLVGHAEALLLVDDQQPQILELHIFLQEFMGADQQVQTAGAGGLQNAFLFLGGGEPGEHLDLHWEIFEPAAGGGIVLLGQNGGRHQDRRLLAVQNTFHNGPERHLRLAIAHIAAEQAIHGPGLLHILFDVGDGL